MQFQVVMMEMSQGEKKEKCAVKLNLSTTFSLSVLRTRFIYKQGPCIDPCLSPEISLSVACGMFPPNIIHSVLPSIFGMKVDNILLV